MFRRMIAPHRIPVSVASVVSLVTFAVIAGSALASCRQGQPAPGTFSTSESVRDETARALRDLGQWPTRHAAAAAELGRWIRRNPDAAQGLVAWTSQNPADGQALLAWALPHPYETFEVRVDAEPMWAPLKDVIVESPQAFLDLAAWVRQKPEAARELARAPGDIAWLFGHAYGISQAEPEQVTFMQAF